MSGARPTIGLCMIVRDEAAVIERCLASVRSMIDHWTVCDTGSQDGTQRIVCAALDGLPGALHEREWRDFGHNRTELMALAAGTADHLLLLDADMTLRPDGPLPALEADAQLLRHEGALEYWVPRLVRGDRAWRFEGVTHEHLALDVPYSQERLPGLVVVHHADGGSRADKLERDRRLLEAHLEAEPDDVRATFYLAQTLRDLGDDAAAAGLYARRSQMGGWNEEAYYAAFQAGVLLARTDLGRGEAALRAAAELRPGRGEAVYELARLLRATGRHEEARELAARSAALAPPDDVLFVHRDVHAWGLRFEQAMAAHHAGPPGEALALADALLDEGRLPGDVEAALRESRPYFVAALGQDERDAPARRLVDLAPSFHAGRIALEADPPWPAFNPSIAADPQGGYRVVVRTANYSIGEDGRYDIAQDDRVVRTINYVLRLDDGLAVESVTPLAEPEDAPPLHPSRVEGVEDLRLVIVAGRWLATATARDRDPGGMCRMTLMELGADGTVPRARLLPGPDAARHEKNWMPFVAGDELLLVYSLGPTVVLGCDTATAEVREIARHAAPAWAAQLRGGSQGVEAGGGRLFVVHEVVREAGPRQYVHRFVMLDDEYRLAAASPRFSLSGRDIEMCLGLAPRGDDLLLSFGTGDEEAWLGVVSSEEVLALLLPVE